MAAIMRKMNIISRCESIYRTQQLKEEMPGIFHSYVLVICRKPGMSQDKLARHLCLNKSNVTRHLAKLEQKGYIERRVSEEDKRELLVYPTERMLDLQPEVVRITKEWNALVSEDVTEEELEVFHRVLDKMLEKSKSIVYGEENQNENGI
jgi:DNA-binding MarR family transcriptional regulator